jgi:hypothetical protein
LAEEDLNKSMDNNLLKLIDTLYLRSDCKCNARPTIVIISNVPLKPYDKRPVTADNIEVCESNVPLKPYDKRPDKRRREINKERIEEFKNILASYSCTRKVRIEIILIKEREVKEAKGFDIELLGLQTYLKKEYHDRWIISNYNLLTSGWGFTLNIEKAESKPIVRKTMLTFSTVFMKDTLMAVNDNFEFVCKLEEFAKNEKTKKYFILERFKGK